MLKKKMKPSVVTFGEIMLRLMPYNFERFTQTNHFQATYGGGEANVAVSLAQYGNDAWFVTVLPDNPMGQAALHQLRGYGVHTEAIKFNGKRLGIYFLEQGASLRPSRVVYDRGNSAIASAAPDTFDWDTIFANKSWFHFTGITPAISPACAEMTLSAVKAAKQSGLTVSCDLNYRNKLWTRDEAYNVMSDLVQFTDVIIANEADCADVFGIEAENTDVESGKLDEAHYRSVASQMMKLSKAQVIAITLRESLSASDNNWSAMLYDGSDFYTSKKYAIHLVDRVGGGDSFGAGLIHSMLHGKSMTDALEFAVAASALKQTIPGDMNLVSEDEVMEIVNGNLSGRVQR
ncbi:MAG: ribokinase family protein [Proteiniphilum acetatigenes]|uniref:Ribokinase family protein n=1 Tax=Proteiniphilum acetatigenes TaxID=294710 RepID=A0A117M1B1_9BACT|nr:MAG: ribokinase family protein [Proteiniphilum acetatigenes]